MKLICNTEYSQRTFTFEEAEEFFGVSYEVLKSAIENGTSISKGVRYWFIDEKV